MEAAPRIELGIKVLQTSALPLGYAAIVERKTGLTGPQDTLIVYPFNVFLSSPFLHFVKRPVLSPRLPHDK